MSDTQLHDSISNTGSTATPGELLQRQREELGVPLNDAARALNLRPAVVEGLERDNYEEIPIIAYRRGYLRSYARYLDMDERLVLEAYQVHNGSTDTERKVAPVSSVSKPPSRLGAWLFKLVTVLVIVGLIAVTVMWWQSRGGSEPPSIGSAPSMEEGGNFSSSMNAESPSEGEPTTPIATPQLQTPVAEPDADAEIASSPVNQTPSVTGTDASALVAEGEFETASVDSNATQSEQPPLAAVEIPDTETDSETPPEAAPAPEPSLELTFNEQSWTEVFDASNQRVFVGLQSPGTTASVEGEPPFRLTIGNATGVELRYQGEVINLAQRAGANNVARFTLGE